MNINVYVVESASLSDTNNGPDRFVLQGIYASEELAEEATAKAAADALLTAFGEVGYSLTHFTSDNDDSYDHLFVITDLEEDLQVAWFRVRTMPIRGTDSFTTKMMGML